MTTDEFSEATGTTAAAFAAEQATLGAVLVRPDLVADVLGVLRPSDFSDPRHAELAMIVLELYVSERPVDPQTVLAEVMKRGAVGRLGGGPYLHTLMERAFVPANALVYAAEVQSSARLRELTASLIEARQRLGQPEADLDRIVAGLTTRLDELRAAGRMDEPLAPTVAEITEGEDTFDWLVEGLLERGDRFMLTGTEGGGKSVLLAQMAVCLAAGLHPFSHHRTPPLRVLVIDCENPPTLIRRRYRNLIRHAERVGSPVRPDRLRIDMRPEGLDLGRDRDAGWLLRRVSAHRPEVLVTGPLYRLHMANPNDEETARHVASALDAARLRVNCALLLESHSPHKESGAPERSLRPIGSSLWMRWTAFGYGLREVKVEHGPRSFLFRNWKGDRDVRQWPTKLEHGTTWPWVEAAPDAAWGAA